MRAHLSWSLHFLCTASRLANGRCCLHRRQWTSLELWLVLWSMELWAPTFYKIRKEISMIYWEDWRVDFVGFKVFPILIPPNRDGSGEVNFVFVLSLHTRFTHLDYLCFLPSYFHLFLQIWSWWTNKNRWGFYSFFEKLSTLNYRRIRIGTLECSIGPCHDQ